MFGGAEHPRLAVALSAIDQLCLSHAQGREALPQAVDEELHRQRGEEDTEQAGDDINTGFAQEALYTAGEQEHGKCDGEHKQDDGEDADGDHEATVAGQQHDGSERAGASDQRDGEREHGDVAALAGFHTFLFGGGAEAGVAHEQHVDGHQEQQNAASHAEGGHANAEVIQQNRAGEGKECQHRSGNEHALDGDVSALGQAILAGQPGENWRQAEWVDDYQEEYERLQEKVHIDYLASETAVIPGHPKSTS